MTAPAPGFRARATLAEFAQMFLQEVEKANRGFTLGKLEWLEKFRDPERRRELVDSIGANPSQSDLIATLLGSQVAEAARLRISEVRVTFWLEPARRGCWECIVAFLSRVFCCRKPRALAGIYCLAPAERSARASQFEVTIAATDDLRLGVSEPRRLPPADISQAPSFNS